MALAMPVTYSATLSYGIGLIGVLFVGRLGELPLSVALLGISLHNVMGYAIVSGFSGVLETVCGQANGAQHYASVGLALQRAILLALALCGLISGVWLLGAERMILAMGQDPEIARHAALFLRLTCPALFGEGLMSVLVRYLQAQGRVWPPVVSSTVAALLAPLIYWLLMFRAGLGLRGAAISMSAVQLLLLAVLAVLVQRHHAALRGSPRQVWHGWSAAALRGWGVYARLGLPSVAMNVVEWSAFEVCVIEAGWLPRPEISLAVMGLSLNITTFLYMIPMGIGAGCSTRVSNALGAGLPRAARRAALSALALGLASQLAVVGALLPARGRVVGLLTSSPRVVEAARGPMLVVCGAMLNDGVNAVAGGMLRGAGRQNLGAISMIVCYWGAAVPLGYALAFHGPRLGVAGLWWGLLGAGLVMVAFNLGMAARTDWERQAQNAAKTLAAQGTGPVPLEDDDDEENAGHHFVVDP